MFGGDDSLTIDFSQGGFAKSIDYYGGLGSDRLALVGGSFSTATYTYTGPNDGAIDLDGLAITYAGLDPIDGATADNIVLNLPAGVTDVELMDWERQATAFRKLPARGSRQRRSPIRRVR